MAEGLKAIGRAIYERKINLAVAIGINVLTFAPPLAPNGIGIGVINPDSSGWYLTTSNTSTSRRKWGVGLEWLDLSPADYTKPLWYGRSLEPSTLSHRVTIGITAEGFKYENTIERVPAYIRPSAAPEVVHSP